jgi:hypothetical protein
MPLRIQKPARKSPLRRPWFEALETRLTPAAFNPLPGAADGAAGSLRAAVIAANGNGQDNTINLQAGQYNLSLANTTQENAAATGDLDLTGAGHTITFQGAGSDVTVIAGDSIDRVFQVFANVTVVFRGLTITGGLASDDGTAGTASGGSDARGGGILNDGGNVTLDHVLLENNSATGGVGAVGGPGRNAQGGGIFTSSGSLTILDCSLEQNFAQGGQGNNGNSGATGVPGAAGAAGGSGQGGAVYVAGGTVTITDTTLSGNFALGADGTDGSAGGGAGGPGGGGQGGGVFVAGGTLTITGSTLTANSARGHVGGAGGAGAGAVPGGMGGAGGGGQGAAAFAGGGTLTLVNSTVSGNGLFGGQGGNGGASGGGSVAGNGGAAGSPQGGGVFVGAGATAVLHNSTIADNEAPSSQGGAAGSGSSGTAGTAGPGQGGGLCNAGGIVNAVSTIFANDFAGGAGPDVFGNLTTASHNLLRNGTGSNLAAANPDANGNRVGTTGHLIDPILRPLASNGGPTQTYALYPNSPAIDAGANPDGLATDQRGLGPRAAGAAPDIGAFEFGAGLPGPQETPPSTLPTTAPPASAPMHHALTVRQVRLKGRTGLDVFDAATGARKGRLFPFGALRVKVTVLTADLNGDGTDDLLALAVVGGRLRSRAFSGVDLSPLPGIPS